jgi:phosphoribosylformylglycinamidine synthase subunit PurL
MAIAGECGFDVTIGGAAECFSESASRVVVAVDDALVDDVLARAAAAGVPATEIGTAGGDRLVARGAFDIALADASAAWRDAIPNALGADVVAR